MENVINKKTVYSSASFTAGVLVGVLFTLNPIIGLIGFVLLNILVPVMLSMAKMEFKYWLQLGFPAIGFALGYMLALGAR